MSLPWKWISAITLLVSFSSFAQVVAPPTLVTGALANHSCIINAGALICWGDNQYGQLGDGTAVDSPLPITIITTGVTAASIGPKHSCAIAAGTLRCWGSNDNGRLGIGVDYTDAYIPTTVVAGATAVAVGEDHTCAIIAKVVKCWGSDSDGQIGDAAQTTGHEGNVFNGDVYRPKNTIAIPGATRIFAGANHSCAIYGTALKCWGRNVEGQLALGDYGTDEQDDSDDTQNYDSKDAPFVVEAAGVTTVSLGRNHSCGISTEFNPGELLCAGANDNGQLGVGGTTGNSIAKTAIESGVTSVVLGSDHTCAIRLGSLKCWGKNTDSQVGDGDTTNVETPATIFGLNVGSISLGAAHTCAVVNKEVTCVGNNSFGQLGDGSEDNSADWVYPVLE